MKIPEWKEFDRRQFLKGGSLATLMTLMGGIELTFAQEKKDAAPLADDSEAGDPLNVAVIGMGAWGREIATTLGRLKTANVSAVCDKYPASLKRGGNAAPKAKQIADYKQIIDDKEIKAIIVATPSHLHKEIVLAAIQAGKHVYCEAPLAHTIEDAKAIAQAAKNNPKLVFQSGLQNRSDPQRIFLLPFIRAGAMGKNVMGRTQWHKKSSWRLTSPNPDREKELNWRLFKDTSPGLMGEIAIHHIDAASWFLNVKPRSVTGFGSKIHWTEDRDINDTVHSMFEYPAGVRLSSEVTLANSFDADYEVYYGTDAAIMLRNNKAWMFKEVDSPLLGWEVYARRDTFFSEEGIALMADATKQKAHGNAQEAVANPFTPLYYAMEAFVHNVGEIGTAVEDFTATFSNADNKALEEHLSKITRLHAAGYKEGFEATVMALKANEAVINGSKQEISKELFKLA
jgi:predicted dehydrogenase